MSQLSNQQDKIYDVVIITDRNYGLYAGFATQILGLSTYILEIKDMNKKHWTGEDQIWPSETREDYMFSIEKLNIPVSNVSSLFYNVIEKQVSVTYYQTTKDLKPSKIQCKYLIFALSINHNLLPKQKVKITNFSFKDSFYVIGEKALYDNKIFQQDIYTGEANLVAQAIYNEINQTTGMIVVHSTSVIK